LYNNFIYLQKKKEKQKETKKKEFPSLSVFVLSFFSRLSFYFLEIKLSLVLYSQAPFEALNLSHQLPILIWLPLARVN